MIEIRRILCPTDFSEFSRHAFDQAVALARWYEAEITAVHMVPLVPAVTSMAPSVNPVTLGPMQRDVVVREMEQFVAPAREADIKVQVEVREGSVAFQVLELAAETSADMIVLGTHGRGGFERWVLGSVAEKVLRKASCPVLTVPGPAVEPAPGRAPFRNILCPVDFSPPSMKALEYALTLAEEADGRFTVLHAIEGFPGEAATEYPQWDVERYRRIVEEDVQARLHRAIPEEARRYCDARERLVSGKAYREILRVAAEEQVDLIALGVHGRNPLDLMLFGSTTQHVVRGAACPVLTIRA